jgi:acyl dehydratase
VSAAATTTFDTSRVGVTVASPAIEVTAAQARDFAAATDEQHPDLLAGRLAPPLFAIVPVLRTMVDAKNAVTSAFAFHGEHDLLLHRPIVPGMSLRAAATVIGVRQRSAGVATVVRVETRTRAGDLVNEQHFTSFVSGGHVPEPAGVDAPAHVPPPPRDAAAVRELRYPLAPDQTRRFAAASGDWDAYTLDESVARAMGFPTIIVHGTCTLAFAARAVVQAACDGDPRRLRRFAARLSRPLLLVAGQALTTRIWPAGDPDGRSYGFDAVDHEGTMMLKNGLAEVAP